MDVVQRVLDYLKTVEGVLDAYEMDDSVSEAVWDTERTVRTRLDSGYRNVGYDHAMQRGHRLCVFYDETYIFGKRSVLKLMTSDGTIMGTSVAQKDMEAFRARDDVLWISEDFVVFPNVVGKGEEAFVLFPIELPEVEENVPCCSGAIASSPTPSSDEILKAKFKKPMVKGLYTMVIAFDEKE